MQGVSRDEHRNQCCCARAVRKRPLCAPPRQRWPPLQPRNALPRGPPRHLFRGLRRPCRVVQWPSTKNLSAEGGEGGGWGYVNGATPRPHARRVRSLGIGGRTRHRQESSKMRTQGPLHSALWSKCCNAPHTTGLRLEIHRTKVGIWPFVVEETPNFERSGEKGPRMNPFRATGIAHEGGLGLAGRLWRYARSVHRPSTTQAPNFSVLRHGSTPHQQSQSSGAAACCAMLQLFVLADEWPTSCLGIARTCFWAP